MPVAEEAAGGNLLGGEGGEDEHRHPKLQGRRQPGPVPLDLLLPKARAPGVRLFPGDLPTEDPMGINPSLAVREKSLKSDGRRNQEAEKSGHVKEESGVWLRGMKSPWHGVSRDVSSKLGRGRGKTGVMGTHRCAWSGAAGTQARAAGF